MKPEAHLNLILENVKLFQIHGHEKKCWKCKARKKIEPFVIECRQNCTHTQNY